MRDSVVFLLWLPSSALQVDLASLSLCVTDTSGAGVVVNQGVFHTAAALCLRPSINAGGLDRGGSRRGVYVPSLSVLDPLACLVPLRPLLLVIAFFSLLGLLLGLMRKV